VAIHEPGSGAALFQSLSDLNNEFNILWVEEPMPMPMPIPMHNNPHEEEKVGVPDDYLMQMIQEPDEDLSEEYE